MNGSPCLSPPPLPVRCWTSWPSPRAGCTSWATRASARARWRWRLGACGASQRQTLNFGHGVARQTEWKGTAAETADTLLILDEMGQADPREVADVVYMLANEAGKQRAARNGTARRRQSWRTLFLSTGEITLAQKMGEAGKRAMAGLDVRLANLPADAGAGMGIFQNLHGRPSAAALADELRGAARAHHGTAARAFLAKLAYDRAKDGATLRATLDELRASFLTKHVPADATGQVRSVAGRFALIGAAGELARDYGVLPWPASEAMRAAGACFMAWLAERGGAVPARIPQHWRKFGGSWKRTGKPVHAVNSFVRWCRPRPSRSVSHHQPGGVAPSGVGRGWRKVGIPCASRGVEN